MWVLVLGLNEPSKDVEALTKGENLEADIQRLLISTDANIIQEVKKIPDQIALLSHYLDTKIIYIPIVDALSIIRNYANNDLKKIMKNRHFYIWSFAEVGKGQLLLWMEVDA